MNKASPSRWAKRWSVLLAGVLSVTGAWAVTPFTVRDIRIEGLQRVEPGTVFASMPVRVGDVYSDEVGVASIRSLFGLGLFKDVRLDVKDDVLVVIVEERPTIAEVDFVGIKEFEKDTLKKALRDIGLTDGRAFDKALADRAEQELKRQYINRSLYAAEVVTTVTPAERNRVNLVFSVVEGGPARIKEIRIVGGSVFTESALRSELELGTSNWFSWYTKADRYSRTKLNADLETLRSYYLNRGYLDFRIDSTQVAISPNKEDISITINVTEGQQFVVSSVGLDGNYLDRDSEFKTLIKIEPGKPYNFEQVTQTVKAFTDYYSKFGFAFARVEPRPEVDRNTNQVKLTLVGDPQRRAYVRRINVTGNTLTRDEVIRREMRQLESSWYDGDRIKLSKERLERLGFFKEVNVETEEIAGVPDQVDLVVKVEEKPTGTLQLGAGYSQFEKLSLSFAFAQENAFGSGNYLNLNVNTSRFNRVLALNYTDPYFTPDGVSRTIEGYYRSSRPYNDIGGNYQLTTLGTGVRFGVPFTEYDRVYFGGNLEQTRIVPGTNMPAAYVDFATRYGYRSLGVPLSVGWARDNRDSLLSPTRGRFQRFSADTSFLADARYVRTSYQFQEFFPITKRWTVAVNADVALGRGLGGHPYPVFKNAYSGGLGSVRGYAQSTLGPRDVTGSVVGGAKKVNFSTELIGPLPGAGTEKSLRWYAFGDIGNVFGENQPIQFSELRASVGLGLSWLSPVGPLRIALSRPMRMQPGDRIERFQFQIGTLF